ncbi:MAG: dihydroxy-acid dehydratase [Actinomycetes bacterium]
MTGLRSRAWFDGDDEVGLLHRAALRASNVVGDPAQDQPVIGIANSASELNPCNLPLTRLAAAVKQGVAQAGGIPVEFPTISLGEDLMKPSAMLYRNLLAIEIEETLRAYPLDGVVLLANCDKTVPGALLGAISADLPTILITGGARPPARFHGQRIGTGTDLWRLWDERRAGRLDDPAWIEVERVLGAGQGACNTMGTASTMAMVSEALGLMLSGSSTVPAGDPRGVELARHAGGRVVELVGEDRRPSTLLTRPAFANAVRVLHAIGGSTNAVIHLIAMARRVGVDLQLDDIDRLGGDVPLLVDVEPSGTGLVQDLDVAGGLPAVMRQLRPLLDQDVAGVDPRSLSDILDAAPEPSGVLRPRHAPLRTGGVISVVRGSLAPDGAVIKTSAATPALLRHTGPAIVFHGYADLRARIDDPSLTVDADTVLVLTGCGPVGVPGMPEWGMVPIPARLVAAGVRDMVRVTDARMSGTSFGTVVLHVAPESAVGGPLGLVHDGDLVSLDVTEGRIDLLVEPGELDRRRACWTPPASEHLRGWPALYAQHVNQAPDGCDLDFLTAPTSEHRRFIPPVIGRS